MLQSGEFMRQSVIIRLTRSLVLLYLNQCQLGIQISHKQSEYQTFWPQRISANKIKFERYYLNMIKCQWCYLNLCLQKITVKRKYHICGFHMSKHNRSILTDHVNRWRMSCASQKYIYFELDASSLVRGSLHASSSGLHYLFTFIPTCTSGVLKWGDI